MTAGELERRVKALADLRRGEARVTEALEAENTGTEAERLDALRDRFADATRIRLAEELDALARLVVLSRRLRRAG